MAEEPKTEAVKDLGLKGTQVVPIKEQLALLIVSQ
jgi:hypothetical protein